MSSHDFCRILLSETLKDVKKVTTPEERKAAYAYKNSAGYEFHGPDGFYVFLGNKADCLSSAKANGWDKWMESKLTCVCGQEFTSGEAADVRLSGTCPACGGQEFYRIVASSHIISSVDKVQTDFMEGFRDPKPEEIGTKKTGNMTVMVPGRRFPLYKGKKP